MLALCLLWLPDNAPILGIHVAANGTVEGFGELVVITERPKNPGVKKSKETARSIKLGLFTY